MLKNEVMCLMFVEEDMKNLSCPYCGTGNTSKEFFMWGIKKSSLGIG